MERVGAQLRITIERRRTRSLLLDLDDAARLHDLIGRELPPVTVRKAARL